MLSNKEDIMQLIQNLTKFSTAYGGLLEYILRSWYQCILRKTLTYAAAAWHDKLQKSHGNRVLNSPQYQCLIFVTKAYIRHRQWRS